MRYDDLKLWTDGNPKTIKKIKTATEIIDTCYVDDGKVILTVPFGWGNTVYLFRTYLGLDELAKALKPYLKDND